MKPWLNFELGLVTIEMTSAFLASAADGDNLFDAVFVTDANGLPTIPGESIAGVLRHALAGADDPETNSLCREIFGYQERDEGAASRVRISFAHAHGQDDWPVPFRGARRDDPVLAFLQAGVGRDHVRVGMHGAVDDRGKFDELIVPAGARFTFELCVSAESPWRFEALLGVIARPEVRLGRGTRHGLGGFRVVRARILDKHEDLSKLPVALDKAARSDLLKECKIGDPEMGEGWVRGKISLTPLGTWMIGGGMPTGREPQHPNNSPWERIPLSEGRVDWTRGRGEVVRDEKAPYLVPGSSLKGALRHRTAFHARRLRESFMRRNDVAGHLDDPPTAIETWLFGEARDRSSGKPGRVLISDSYVDAKTPLQPLHHVSLDRFTQGPMDHLLYDELALRGGELKIDVAIRLDGEIPEKAREALGAALEDLCHGRLSIGAGRGHGRFKSPGIDWADGKGLLAEEVTA